MDEQKLTWTVRVQQHRDSDDLILPLPQELLEHMQWKPGDTLLWRDLGQGSWALEKISQT